MIKTGTKNQYLCFCGFAAYGSKGYRFYCPQAKKIIRSRDARFLEENRNGPISPCLPTMKGSLSVTQKRSLLWCYQLQSLFFLNVMKTLNLRLELVQSRGATLITTAVRIMIRFSQMLLVAHKENVTLLADTHWKLDQFFTTHGFCPLNVDPTIYLLQKDDSICLVGVYVDDLLFSSRNVELLLEVKQTLQGTNWKKDLAVVKHFSGMHIQ